MRWSWGGGMLESWAEGGRGLESASWAKRACVEELSGMKEWNWLRGTEQVNGGTAVPEDFLQVWQKTIVVCVFVSLIICLYRFLPGVSLPQRTGTINGDCKQAARTVVAKLPTHYSEHFTVLLSSQWAFTSVVYTEIAVSYFLDNRKWLQCIKTFLLSWELIKLALLARGTVSQKCSNSYIRMNEVENLVVVSKRGFAHQLESRCEGCLVASSLFATKYLSFTWMECQIFVTCPWL